MRPTVVVYIAASLDGYISRDDGSIDWLKPVEDEQAFERFASFLASVDAVVMVEVLHEIAPKIRPSVINESAAALGQAVNGPRNDFLTRARLTMDQDG